MCDLYLGATNARASTPPVPVYTNPSIQSSTYLFTAGDTYSLDVVLQNHDTVSGCSGALVNLYWSDPTTSFLIAAANQIMPTGTPVLPIAAATTIPPADAATTFPFTWTPSLAVAATNGGHVCLAAIASSTTTDCVAPPPCGPGDPATITSPQVAFHNVQVVPPPPPPPRPGGRWGHPLPFFFGAAHGGDLAGVTRLVARALDPAVEEDRWPLLQLAGLPSVRRAFGRCLKFGTPAELSLALGAETVVVPGFRGAVPPPRLGFTGPVAAELAEELVQRAWVKSAHGAAVVSREIELVPRQVKQAAVQVLPGHEDGRVYAIEIAHDRIVHGQPAERLGGLTVLFAAPCRPW